MKSAIIFLVGLFVGAEVTNMSYRPVLALQMNNVHHLREHGKTMDIRIGDLSDRIKDKDDELSDRLEHEKVFRIVLKQLGLTEHVALMESKVVLGKGEGE